MKLSNVRNRECYFLERPDFTALPLESWTVYLDGSRETLVDYLKALCIHRKRHGNSITVCILNENLKGLGQVWCLSTFKLGYMETDDFEPSTSVETPEPLDAPQTVQSVQPVDHPVDHIVDQAGDRFGPFHVINLERRSDRWTLFQQNFQKYSVPYLRFSAIEDKNGALGCAKSHCAVLQAQKDLPFAFVAEDDATIQSSFKDVVLEFMETSADVLLLGYNTRIFKPYQGSFFRVMNSLTTSCYVVRNSMIPSLLACFEKCILDMSTGRQNPIDLEWQSLQKTFTFIVPKRRLVIQRESFSDIERKMVNYRV